jgi:hypothetical protein
MINGLGENRGEQKRTEENRANNYFKYKIDLYILLLK